jgi:hypothetical protein
VLPSGVSVSVYQTRSDYGPRALEISVKNSSRADLTVTHASFVSPHFASASTWTRATVVPFGVIRDLRVPLGHTVCAPTSTGPDRVRLSFTLADGRRGSATVEPTDPFLAVRTVTTQDCLDDLTVEHVALSLGGALRTVSRGGHAVGLVDLTLTPTGAAGAITIDSIGGTIMIRPDSGAPGWPVASTFTADAAPRTITLDLVPNNCRIHTVAEDKRGTYFPVHVTTSGGVEGTWYLRSSDSLRESIYAYIAEYCGWSAGTSA